MEVVRPFTPQTSSPSEKRKLLRSTGSFSFVEEIVAPTPRKLSSVPSSPVQGRREKRKSTEENLFGEAGQELQTILLEGPSMRAQNVIDWNPYERAASVSPSPPTRAANPVALNSSFGQAESVVTRPVAMRQHTGFRGFVGTSKALHRVASRDHKNLARFRSASWPDNGKVKSDTKHSLVF